MTKYIKEINLNYFKNKMNDETLKFFYEFSKNGVYIEMYRKNLENSYEFLSAYKKNAKHLNREEMVFYFYLYEKINKLNFQENCFEFLRKDKVLLNRIAKN